MWVEAHFSNEPVLDFFDIAEGRSEITWRDSIIHDEILTISFWEQKTTRALEHVWLHTQLLSHQIQHPLLWKNTDQHTHNSYNDKHLHNVPPAFYSTPDSISTYYMTKNSLSSEPRDAFIQF